MAVLYGYSLYSCFKFKLFQNKNLKNTIFESKIQGSYLLCEACSLAPVRRNSSLSHPPKASWFCQLYHLVKLPCRGISLRRVCTLLWTVSAWRAVTWRPQGMERVKTKHSHVCPWPGTKPSWLWLVPQDPEYRPSLLLLGPALPFRKRDQFQSRGIYFDTVSGSS